VTASPPADAPPSRLGRRQALPLAVGSVAGSGILFLPSAVYAEAGPASLVVWLVATGLCLPMLLMFEDMVRTHPDGDGIEAFVRAGLGHVAGRCVPVLFVALVVVGLPAGSNVAGRYVADALGAGGTVGLVGAVALLVTAVAVVVAGAEASARVQRVGTVALVAMALGLIAAATPGLADGLDRVRPDAGHLGAVLPGALLAFWAFAGFENLTFLSRELRDPGRDFLPVSALALATYGLLTVLLTVAIAVRVPREAVDDVTGLLQLAETVRPRALVVGVVTGIAFGAMGLNAVAWVWGVSRLMAGAAAAGTLPRAMARTTDAGVPRRAIAVLAALFAVTTAVLAVAPGLVVDAVATAGALFVVLYLLSIVSYVRVRGPTARSAANLALLVVLAAALVQSGWRSAYAVVVLALALAGQTLAARRRAGSPTASRPTGG
jgi:amino acid efflux transporter